MSKKAMEHVDSRDLAEADLWRKEADEAEPKRRSGKKNTRSWCKGKEGREHTLAIEMPPNAWRTKCYWVTNMGSDPWYWCSHVELCTVCGKQLRHNYGRRSAAGDLRNEECPDYIPR